MGGLNKDLQLQRSRKVAGEENGRMVIPVGVLNPRGKAQMVFMWCLFWHWVSFI